MKSWLEVSLIEDLQIGKLTRLEPEDIDPIVVYRKNSDEYFVFTDRCSHADVRLSKGCIAENGLALVCKAHGAHFDLSSGAPLSAPATAPLDTWTWKIESEKLFVSVEE